MVFSSASFIKLSLSLRWNKDCEGVFRTISFLFGILRLTTCHSFPHLPDLPPRGSEGKASACSMGDLGLIPGSGRSLGEGNTENPMDGGAWWATVHGSAKSRTPLSDLLLSSSRRRGKRRRSRG